MADANSHMPCHAYTAPMPRFAVALIIRFQNGMVVAWHGRGMACVNQTRLHCVYQMGKTQSKPLAARHGRGTAWGRHSMCELAVILPGHSVSSSSSSNVGCWALKTKVLLSSTFPEILILASTAATALSGTVAYVA
jgi:hypothetical protein